MKSVKNILLPLVLMFFASCTERNVNAGEGKDNFSISPEELLFSSSSGNQLVSVTCNGEWHIAEPGETWCSAEKRGNDIIEVTVTQNLDRKERTADLPVCHDEKVIYLKITQSGRNSDPDNPDRPEVPEGGYTLTEGTIMVDSEVNGLLDGGYDNGAYDKAFYLKKPVPEGKQPVQGGHWVFNTPSETFPDGCLAFIQEVKDLGDRYEVRYTKDGLGACFRDINLPEQELDITPYVTRIEDENGRPLSFSRTRAASKSEPFSIKIHPGAISLDNLEIEPTINLSTVLKTRVDLEDYKLYSLDFVADTDCTIEMDYNVSAGVDFDYHMPVLKVYMSAIPVGPILVTPFLEVDLTVGSCIQGSINAKYEYSRHCRASVHYDYLNSWSADMSSPDQDDSGWRPSRLGPKLSCSTRYGIGIGPEIGLYGDVVSVGFFINAQMQHQVEAFLSWKWNDNNVINVLQDTDYTTSFILGAYVSANGLGFPFHLSFPDLEFPICSWKMLPSISSVEQDCVGTQASFAVRLKNKTLYTDLPMRVRLIPSGGSAQDAVTAEFGDVSGQLEALNAGAESVCIETSLSLDEGVEYYGYVDMYLGEEIGWSAVPGTILNVIPVSAGCYDAFKEILADIYSCRSGEWKDCNWMEPGVNVTELAHVGFKDGHWGIGIPEEWKLSSNIKVGNHTGGVSGFRSWSLNASGNDARTFTNVEVNDKNCTGFNVGEHVENYAIHSEKLVKLDIPEDVRTLDLSGTAFTSLHFTPSIYKNLNSIKLDNCIQLTELLFSNTELTALPAFSVTGCNALKNVTIYDSIIEEGAFRDITWPSGLKRLSIEGSRITAKTLDVAVPDLFISTTTCGDLAISGCAGMKDLWMSLDTGGNISVSQCASLQTFRIGWNIAGLSVTSCPALTSLTARECKMSSFQASSLPSLTELNVYNNKNLTGVMLPIFDEVRSKPGSSLSYDQRYWYYSDGSYRDNGYGYWYEGEPDRGYHLE